MENVCDACGLEMIEHKSTKSLRRSQTDTCVCSSTQIYPTGNIENCKISKSSTNNKIRTSKNFVENYSNTSDTNSCVKCWSWTPTKNTITVENKHKQTDTNSSLKYMSWTPRKTEAQSATNDDKIPFNDETDTSNHKLNEINSLSQSLIAKNTSTRVMSMVEDVSLSNESVLQHHVSDRFKYEYSCNNDDTDVTTAVNNNGLPSAKSLEKLRPSSSTNYKNTSSNFKDNRQDLLDLKTLTSLGKFATQSKEKDLNICINRDVFNASKLCKLCRIDETGIKENNNLPESILQKKLNIIQDLAYDIRAVSKETPCFERFHENCEKINSEKSISKEMLFQKLASQVQETVKLTKNAKVAGLISNSVEKLISSCADSTNFLRNKSLESQNEKQTLLEELLTNIEELTTILNDCQNHGLATRSLHSLVNNLNKAKNKIEVFVVPEKEDSKMTICDDICSCDESMDFFYEICESLSKICYDYESMPQKTKKDYVSSKKPKPKKQQYNIVPHTCLELKKHEDTPKASVGILSETKDNQDISKPIEELCEVCKNHLKENLNYLKPLPPPKELGNVSWQSTEKPTEEPDQIETNKLAPCGASNVTSLNDICLKNFMKSPDGVDPLLRQIYFRNCKPYNDISKTCSVHSCGKDILTPQIDTCHSCQDCPSCMNKQGIISNAFKGINQITLKLFTKSPDGIDPYLRQIYFRKYWQAGSDKPPKLCYACRNECAERISMDKFPKNIPGLDAIDPKLKEVYFSKCEKPATITSEYIKDNSDENYVQPEDSFNDITTQDTSSSVAQSESNISSNRLGYFEKKVRRIKRITRSMNPDGTINIAREDITIKSETHDPSATEIIEDNVATKDAKCGSNNVQTFFIPELNQTKYVPNELTSECSYQYSIESILPEPQDKKK